MGVPRSALDDPAAARDLDLACEGVPGWKLFELASALERALGVPPVLVPLDSLTSFTRLIEKRGRGTPASNLRNLFTALLLHNFVSR